MMAGPHVDPAAGIVVTIRNALANGMEVRVSRGKRWAIAFAKDADDIPSAKREAIKRLEMFETAARPGDTKSGGA